MMLDLGRNLGIPPWLFPVAPYLILGAVDLIVIAMRRRGIGGSRDQVRAVRGFVFLQVLSLMVLGGSPLLFGFWPRPAWIFLFGCAVTWLGLVIVLAAMASLGSQWAMTLDVDGGHRLVTRGLYRYYRHPLYLGLAVMGIGSVASLSNPYVAVPALACFVAATEARVRSEERHLAEAHGTSYAAYRDATFSWLPFLR